MLSTSSTFKTAIKAPERRFQVALEMFLQTPVTATATGPGTNANQVCDGLFRPMEYKTSGSITIPAVEGWSGAAVSTDTGSITKETVTISYSSQIEIRNVWMVGRLSNYPVDFVVEALVSSQWINVATVAGNTSWWWSKYLTTPLKVDGLRISITKISTPGEKAFLAEFGTPLKVILTSEDLQLFSTSAETNANFDALIGGVVSAELGADINNELGWFSPTKESSPFYGLIKLGVKMNLHVGIALAEDSFEMVRERVYYVTDWSAPSYSVTAQLTGNDRLFALINKPVVTHVAKYKVTLKEMFATLLTDQGLKENTDFIIDPSIDDQLTVGWIPEGTVGEVLTEYCETALAAVITDNADRILIKDLSSRGLPVDTIGEADMIMSFKNQSSFKSLYAGVAVQYISPELGEEGELATVSDISLGASETRDITVLFDSDVAHISYILPSNANVNITKVKYTTRYCTVTLKNGTTAATTTALEVYGQSLKPTERIYEIASPSDSEWLSERTFTLESSFIQTTARAKEVAESLYGLTSDTQTYSSLEVRGNPTYQLLDVLEIQAGGAIKTSANIRGAIVRMTLDYNGGLNGTITIRKTI